MDTNYKNNNHNIWLFLVITFSYSWLLWLPFVLAGFNIIHLSDSIVSLITLAVALGAFGPMIAAVILNGRKQGKSGIKEFFRNALSLRVKPVYYILALLLPILITALSHYFVNYTGIDKLPDTLFPDSLLSVPAIVIFVPYFLFTLIAAGGQEEFGWRGYAQEPMQQRFGILKGSIILGLIWGLWHLPLWFMPGEGHTYYSFFAFLIYVVSTSVSIGWLYNASGKKLIIPLIIHTAGNVSVPFFPILHLASVPQPGYWVWAGANVIMAVCLTLWFRKNKKIQIQEE